MVGGGGRGGVEMRRRGSLPSMDLHFRVNRVSFCEVVNPATAEIQTSFALCIINICNNLNDTLYLKNLNL